MRRDELTNLVDKLAATLVKNGAVTSNRYRVVMNPDVFEEKMVVDIPYTDEGQWATGYFIQSKVGIKAEIMLDPRCDKNDVFLIRDDK